MLDADKPDKLTQYDLKLCATYRWAGNVAVVLLAGMIVFCAYRIYSIEELTEESLVLLLVGGGGIHIHTLFT